MQRQRGESEKTLWGNSARRNSVDRASIFNVVLNKFKEEFSLVYYDKETELALQLGRMRWVPQATDFNCHKRATQQNREVVVVEIEDYVIKKKLLSQNSFPNCTVTSVIKKCPQGTGQKQG